MLHVKAENTVVDYKMFPVYSPAFQLVSLWSVAIVQTREAFRRSLALINYNKTWSVTCINRQRQTYNALSINTIFNTEKKCLDVVDDELHSFLTMVMMCVYEIYLDSLNTRN